MNRNILEESLEIKYGLAVLNIEGNSHESILFLNNKPITMIFDYCDGTDRCYYVGTEFEKDILINNEKYRNIVNKGEVNLKESLAHQFEYILRLLANSIYKLELFYVLRGSYITSSIPIDGEIKYFTEYGGCPSFVETQSKINKSNLEEYKRNIKNGLRPIVVLLQMEESGNSFILDGHHKLRAYDELKIDPLVLMITKILSNKFNISNGIKILKELGLNDNKILNKYEMAAPYYDKDEIKSVFKL